MADIGSLVIKLAAETADFREDLGKSALLLERHAESMRGSLEKVAEVAKTTFAIAIGVESVGALKELVMHTLETVAALQDLAEQTGASATALSGFAPVATISGVAMEQIGVGLTKLSKGLAGVDDETKGASQALQFLGIKAKDAGGNLRDPAEVMNDIALKLSNFEDGAGKTAIALELFGKSGAGLLPFLKDLAANQDLNIRLTEAEIESAEKASKALGRMRAEHNFVAQTIVTAALPALEELVSELKAVMLGTHNTADAMVKLRDDGTLKTWAQDAAYGMAVVIDALRAVIQMTKAVTGSFEAVWADIELLGTFLAGGKGLNPFSEENQAILKTALEKRNAIVEKANQTYVDLWKMPLLADAVKERFDAINRGETEAAGEAAKPKLNYNSATGALTAAAMAKIESDIKQLQGLTDVETGLLKDRQKIIDLYEGQGYISYKEASEARLNAQQEFTDRLGELYAQEESILKRGLATVAKTTQDKLKLQDKLTEITLRRERLEREAQQSNLEREIKLPGETLKDLQEQVASYAIDVQAHGAGYVQILADTVSGKTTSRYQRSYYIPLTGTGPWDVRLRRITADSTQTSLQNKTFLESYTEVIESKLRYPNSALMALRVDASQFTSIPRRSYDLKLLRVRIPSNYFPETRSYAGVWDGTFKVAWTDNPAWCFYDLVTSTRYGLGSFIPESQVDKWALYRVARYCDELVPNGLGGYEPRFTCNLYLQSREQAYKVVQDMASIFRGMAYWSGGAITVTQDAPQDAVYQFTAANVIGGEFAYQGSSARARHTVALVSWVDPDDFYRQKVEYVEDMAGIARYGVVQADVVAMGCTSRGQANRVGKWLLYSEQSESEIITFRTGLEGAVVRPGDVIKVADSSRSGLRLGGRIAAATTVSVTLDQDLPAGSWRISVLLPTGAVEERQVGSLSGRAVGVTSAFSTAPQAGAIWVLASTQVEVQLFRVVQVAESEPGIHEVTALAHNPDKYGAIEQGLALQPRDITVLSSTPAAPTGLVVTESLYRVKDQALVLIQVGWEQVFGALEYQVSYRVNGGNTITLPRVSSTYLEIRNAEAGDYVFTVRAVGVSGKLGTSATLSQAILGKLQPPDDVQDFVVLRRTTDLLLSWSANTDADLAGYEVRVGTGWDAGTLVGQTAGTQLVHDQSESGQYNYFIRAFDTSGKYSQHVTTFLLTLLAPAAVRQFDVVQSANRLEFRWLPNAEPEVVAYELREGTAWDTSIFIAEVKSSSFTLPSGFDGERSFWIKAIASPGIYSDEATFVSTVVAQPQNANLLVTIDAQATRFPGVKHFASVESVNSEDVLRMDSGVAQSEYLFEVSLPTSYRAQNTLLASIGATLDDRETWSTANYIWSSNAAKRQWTYDGALKSIEARFQMAREDALQAGELYGWRLNGALSGYGSPGSGEAVGVSYGDGRYGSGVLVKDTTRVSWAVSIPGIFHVSFWFIPNQITTSVIWTATGVGVSLLVGFDAVTGSFFLEDQLFNRIVVPYPVNVSDRICLGVCQTATERRLFVGKMGGEVQCASKALAPTAGYTALKLY